MTSAQCALILRLLGGLTRDEIARASLVREPTVARLGRILAELAPGEAEVHLALAGYHLLPSVRGDFLFKLARFAEARAEFERAVAMTRNERERTLLRDRAAACART